MAVDEFAGNGTEMQVHTPGPWAIEMVGRDLDEIMIVSEVAKDEDGHRLPVADLHHGGFDFSDLGYPLKANARLIAAAPELLAALSGLVKEIVALYSSSAPGGNYPGGNRFADADLEVQAARAALRKAGVTDNG